MREMVICSGKVNRYGYRVLPEGIQLDAYLKNPVLLVNHNSEIVSIGKVKNIHLNDKGYLVGTPEFDKKDPIARLYKRKYKKGYVNACSLGGDPIETSTEPELILEGQTKATVSKLELYEISITNIPGDRDAVGSPIELSMIPNIKLKTKVKSNMDYKNIATKLGLHETATEVEIINKIETVQLNLANLNTARIDDLITLGKSNGTVTDANETSIRNLAKLNYGDTAKIIGKAKVESEEKPTDKKEKVELTVESLIKAVQGGIEKKENPGETFLELSKTSEGQERLKQLEAEKPEYYSKLALAYDKPVSEKSN